VLGKGVVDVFEEFISKEAMNLIMGQSILYWIMYFLSIHTTKSKAVPLHAMDVLGGRGGIAPTHSRPRH
jgi:hypothetical protein